MTQEEDKNLVLRHYKQAQDFRRPYETKWTRWYKMYRSYTEAKEKGRANLFVPESLANVERAVARDMRAIWSANPIVTCSPFGPEDETPAHNQEMLLNWEIEQINLYGKMLLWLRDARIYGTAPAKLLWSSKSVNLTAIQEETDEEGNPTYRRVSQPTIRYEGPNLQAVDIFKVYINPLATASEEWDWNLGWVIHQEYRTYDQLKEMDIYKNLSQLKKRTGSVSSEDWRLERLQATGMTTAQADEKEPLFKILEHWEEDRLITLADDEITIFNDDNEFGFIPFVVARPHPIGTEFYGIGEIEKFESLQFELNDIRNQRMDNVNQLINLKIGVNSTMEVDEEALMDTETSIVRVGGDPSQAIRELKFADVTRSGYNEEKIIREDIDHATGQYDPIKGQPSGSRETATEILSLQEAGNVRIDMSLSLLRQQSIKPLFEYMAEMNRRFLNTTQKIRLFGQEVEIGPLDLMGNYDVVVMGAGAAGLSHPAQVQLLTQIVNQFGRFGILNIPEITKEIASIMGIKNVDRFITQPQPATASGGGAPELGAQGAATPSIEQLYGAGGPAEGAR